jgi:hypothetical protein
MGVTTHVRDDVIALRDDERLSIDRVIGSQVHMWVQNFLSSS